MALKIFIFDWNGEDIKICSATNDIPKKWYQITNDDVNCFRATFMKRISILMNHCDVAVFSTQTNPNNDYFHEYILKNALTNLGYVVDTEESSEISFSNTLLKLSVCYKVGLSKYNKHGFIFKDNRVNVKIPIVFSDGETFSEALALYYTYDDFIYVFIAVSFAHFTKLNRKLIVRNQNDCLEYFIKTLITDAHVDYGFIAGDMNYQINKNTIFNMLDNVKLTSDFKNILMYDELYPNLHLFNVKEGVNGAGPLFMPTYALKEGRSQQCRNLVAGDVKEQKINIPLDFVEGNDDLKKHIDAYRTQPSFTNKALIAQDIIKLKSAGNKRLVNLLERFTGVTKYQGDTMKDLYDKLMIALKEEVKVDDDLNTSIKTNIRLYKLNQSTESKNRLRQNIIELESLNNEKYENLIATMKQLTASNLAFSEINKLADRATLLINSIGMIKDKPKDVRKVDKPDSVSDCYQFGVGYHNRILYTNAKCITYDRIDLSSTVSHSAVYGLYTA